MTKWTNMMLLAAILMMGGTAVAQTTVGYTNGTLNRNDIVRFGNTEKQGMAVYVDAEKAALLKGATVKSFLTYVSTTQVERGTLFITRELGGTPLYEQAFKPTSSRERMTEYSLESAYVLDGEPFFFGHTVEVGTSYKPLSFDQSNNTEAGISWAYENGMWIDVSAEGYGVPNIQMKLDGVADFTDLSVRPILAEGYQVAGEPQVFKGQVFNFGNQPITSFDLTCSVGTAEPVVTSVTGVALASGKSYDFTLPAYTTNETGTLDMKVSVSNVNGAADVEETDNSAVSSVFFYPSDIEKKILIEVFTGQACGNCPAGHANLASAIKGIENEFIEVCHHAGYYPDQFTLADSYTYTWLYGNAGTYAPAAMFNRTAVPSISTTSPVFASTDGAAVRTAAQAFRQVQPYVGLKLYNQIDAATRKGTLLVDVETFVVPSDSIHTLNVWLLQDGLVGMQANGGTNYVHNHVFRGTMIGNTWGQQIQLTPGKTVRYSVEYEIPTVVTTNFGDYTGTEIETVLSDMQIVAFVSDFSSTSPTACNVYNAAKISLMTDNLAQGVEETVAGRAPFFTFDGSQIHIVGDFLRADIYTASGALATSLKNGEQTFLLPPGLYVVRTLLPGGGTDVQKLIVK